MIKLSDKKDHDFYARYIGRTAQVLLEKNTHGRSMHGYTDNYIRVELSPAESSPELDNEIVTVRLGDFNFDGSALKAKLIE